MKLRSSLLTRALLVGALALGATAGFAQSSSGGAPDAFLMAVNGILVSNVQSGSPAEKAGIARGDIILEANGTKVDTPADFQRIVGAMKSGDTVRLKIRHGDTEKTVSVVLGTQAGRVWIGIAIADGRWWPEEFRGDRWFDMPFGQNGALVTSVVSGSPAEKAGLKQGDLILSVDGAELAAKKDLAAAIAEKKVGATVTLSIQSRAADGTRQAARDVKVTLGKHPDRDAPYLGVQYAPGMPHFEFGPMQPGVVPGVFVTEVVADGPAAKAGVTTRDVITKVDGAAVGDPQQLLDAIAKHAPGDVVKLTVYRLADAKEAELTVTLGKNPQDNTKAWLGIAMARRLDDLERRALPRRTPLAPGRPSPPSI